MALLFADNFDYYGSGDSLLIWDLFGAWTSIGLVGRYGTGGLQMYGNNGYVRKDFPNVATVICGVAYREPAAQGPGAYVFSLCDGATAQLSLRTAAGGELAVYRDTTLVATSSGLGMTVGVWWHIQFKATIGASGSYEVKAQNITIPALTATGVNTKTSANSYANRFWMASSDNISVVDDFWMCDTSGSQCNDFLGDIRGVSRFANADGTYTDFTPSTGDRHDCVNKTTPTADAKYVTSLTPGHKATFSFPAMGKTGNVKAVVNHVWANKGDAGSRIIKPLMISGATESAGANASLSDTGLYLPPDIHMVDPATGVAWANIAAVDATQVGVEMVS